MISSRFPTPSPMLFGARKKKSAKAPNTPPAPPNTNLPTPPVTSVPVVKKAEALQGPKPTPFDKLKIDETEVIVFDIETTGLVPRADKPGDPVPQGGYDDITELSAIKYKNGKETGRFYSMVKPNKPIPKEVEEKTNITNELVKKKGKPTTEVMAKFIEFIGEKPIMIGHNAKWFDTKFLRAVCERYGMPQFKDKLNYDHVIDTKILAQKLFPDCVWTYDENGKGIPPTPNPGSPPDLKLTSIAKNFGFNTEGAHRAENDVAMAAKVFYKIIEKAKAKGTRLETFGDLYQYQFTPPKKRVPKKP